jgi:hypothetical protein
MPLNGEGRKRSWFWSATSTPRTVDESPLSGCVTWYCVPLICCCSVNV